MIFIMKTLLFFISLVTIGSFLFIKVDGLKDVYHDMGGYAGSGDEPHPLKPLDTDPDRGSGEDPYDSYDDESDYYEDDYYASGSGWGPIHPYPNHRPDIYPDSVPAATNNTEHNHEIYFSREEVVPVQETPKQHMPSNTPEPTLTGTHDEMDSPITILTNKDDDRQVSIFAQPGILAAFIGGAVMGLLCAILLVMFIVYRMRKRDEGSYPLDEPKRVPLTSSYSPNEKEIYA